MAMATKFNMTRKEAQLVVRMAEALETHRLSPLASTFTSQAMAEAIEGLPGVQLRPNQRTLGIILDRMGIIMVARTYRRNTRELEAVLPEWKEEAKRELSREREILFPGMNPHSNTTR